MILNQQQIDKIIKSYVSDNPDVIATVLTGSYVYGLPNKNSDLDLRFVVPENNRIDDKKEFFGVRVEAFFNSPEQIRKYLLEDAETGEPGAVHFWSFGKIVDDQTGIAKTLQNEAQNLWRQGPNDGKGWRNNKYKAMEV